LNAGRGRPPDIGRLALFAACVLGYTNRLLAQDPATPPAKLPWNAWTFPGIALQLHITAMTDGAFFVQDANSISQVGDVPNDAQFRLDNLEVDGQLKAPFPWSFQVEAEYDGADQLNSQRGWTLSGLNVTIPVGRLFSVTVGNQSEGITMERLANSYDLVFMERSTMSSALTVARSSGVRLKGLAASGRMNWSLGWYNGWLTNDLSFSESGNIVNGRIAGLLVDSEDGRTLLHLGAWGDYAEAQQGQTQTRSRPEVYEAPFFVDTGSFPAVSSAGFGVELGAVEGPVTLSAEYTRTAANAPQSGDPHFEGYYVQASWAITGETRPYDRSCGCFGELQPFRSLSFRHGGAGAFEVGARYSNIDLASGAVDGGKFGRWSGAFSWFPTDEFRFEFNYGYGTLDRSGIQGRTHFYQLRLQWEI
jgi:phosphate-selective porin OprO/OprP